MKITVQTEVDSDIATVWRAWNNPEDIMQWNTATDDWHTTASEVDLCVGGKFSSRMEAKDGSAGFDFAGTYTRVIENRFLEYEMEDGRFASVEFLEEGGKVIVTETFDADTVYDAEQQREGWQGILDNFANYVESR